jgi:hypothetical protein
LYDDDMGTVEMLRRDLAAVEAERDELRRWAQQVTDALDGRTLLEFPDSTPARIALLRKVAEAAERLLGHQVFVNPIHGIGALRAAVKAWKQFQEGGR